MQYNFDEVIDRTGNHAAKYDERVKKFGTDDVIPLWIADMDFRTAQPIIDALVGRAGEGIWGYTARPDSYFDTIRAWQMRRMAELCMKYHVPMLSDEIHSDLIFHGKHHTPVASLSPEIAKYVITGISGTKTFNLAGLQASTVVFPDAHTKQVFDSFWQRMDIHRNSAFSLTAMEAAFSEGGEEWFEQLLPYLSDNFDFVVNYCEKHIPKIKTYAPDATYLMWLDCRALGLTNAEPHDFMIRKAKLGLNGGCSFGRSLNGYMRLNAACPRSVLLQALQQLEEAVNAL